MLKYGVRIKNIKAGSLYEYNKGLRDRFDYINSMYDNSPLLYFLLENGLKLSKNKKSTEDIICIDFDYGSRSYEEEVAHLDKLIKKEKSEEKLERLNQIINTVHSNKEKYQKLSKEEIREIFYQEGFEIKYQKKTIKYKMLYRSTGKAKKGSCIFINEKLFKKAYDFIYMGIKLPKENSPIIEASGYVSLIASSIVDTIEIDPKNVLILNDVDREFKTNIISVEIDEEKHCVAKHINDYRLKNTLFDGQALIDSSIFPKWGNGFILLRQHMTKMAAFNSHIQKFFKGYFGELYETALIEDMFGEFHLAKDIKMITTDNAVKWLKFGVTYSQWCERVNQCGNLFGIVKTAHESKLGEYQRMSYQMINSMDMKSMKEICSETKYYIENLKKSDYDFIEFLKLNQNFSNDYEVLVALSEKNPEFIRSEYFRGRKKDIIYKYCNNVKTGKLIQNGDNLTIIGSPYAMLLYSVGENPDIDDTFKYEEGTIQCFTQRFEDGEYLAGFRSPFNALNNCVYLHNTYNEKMFEYFEFGRNVIAINMIGTDLQDRANGSDQDSDFMYVTNQPHIVSHAKYCYINYPTIVNNIPKEKNSYSNTPLNYARIDNNLAASRLAIGESSNLAQLSLTYTYNFEDQKYKDYVCILSCLAQVAIDNAKRKFDVDLDSEIKRIKKDLNVKENGYPLFWKFIKPNFNADRINPKLKCPMNYLCKLKVGEFKPKESTLPMDYFFQSFEVDSNRRKSIKVESLIEKYSLDIHDKNMDKDDDFNILMDMFDELIEDISQTYISKNYLGLISWLINRAFMITEGVRRNHTIINSNTDKNKSILLKVLYKVNPKAVIECFSKNLVDN